MLIRTKIVMCPSYKKHFLAHNMPFVEIKKDFECTVKNLTRLLSIFANVIHMEIDHHIKDASVSIAHHLADVLFVIF